jgi:hypothetical protein
MHDFQTSLNWSKSNQQYDSDVSAIKDMLQGCVEVSSASVELDRLGVDYIAKLRGGADVLIDAKARRQGASKQRGWSCDDPLLAIELWSVTPGGKYKTTFGKTGWTLDEGKLTDMVLYTFDSADCDLRYLLPFHSLRMAARRNIRNWEQRFGLRVQDNRTFESQAVFVPASEVIMAMETTYSATVPQLLDEAQSQLF